MRNYPDFLTAFDEYTEFVEAPESFLRWSAISVIAGAMGRKVWINFKNQELWFPNLYIVLIGGSGVTKKSTSSSFAIDLLGPIDNVRQLTTTFTGASLIQQLSEAAFNDKVTYQGKDYVHSSLYCYSSEAINTIGDKEGGIIHLLTDFYDCKPKGWNDKVAWEKGTKGDGITRVYNMCVNFLGCSTPDWLVKGLGQTDIKGGFASRVIFVCYEGLCPRDFGWDDLPDRRHMRSKLIEDLTEIAHYQGELKTSREYKHEFVAMDRQNKLKLVELGEENTMSSYFARKPFQVAKLSQVLHVSQNDLGTPISGETLLRAKAMIEELEEPLEERLTTMSSSADIQLAGRIWKRVYADPGTRQGLAISSEQIRGWFPHVNRQDITAAMQHLISIRKLSPGQYDRKSRVTWHNVTSTNKTLN